MRDLKLDYLSCTYKGLGPDSDKIDLFLKGREVELVAGYSQCGFH